jgi:hypothetical protein
MTYICDGCNGLKEILISFPISLMNGRYARPGKVEVDLCYGCVRSVYGMKGER